MQNRPSPHLCGKAGFAFFYVNALRRSLLVCRFRLLRGGQLPLMCCCLQARITCRQLICTQVQQTYTSEQHNKQTAANQRNDVRLHHVNSLSVCSTKPAARAFVRRVVFLIAYSSESVQSCPVSVRAMSAVSFSKSVSPSPRRASASSASMRGRLFGWQRRRSFS